MLFNKTNNKYVINAFHLLCEIFIGFSVFGLFFVIFMNYYFTSYETTLLGEFIAKSISFYNEPLSPEVLSFIASGINTTGFKQSLQASVEKDHADVEEYNKPYDNLLMKIIVGMVLGLLVLILLPILLGIIGMEQLNLKYISYSILLHIILIVGFELLFLLFITRYINPVKLYSVFETNKTKTGNYI